MNMLGNRRTLRIVLVSIALSVRSTDARAGSGPVWGEVLPELGSFMVADAWAMCTCPPGGGGSVPPLPVTDVFGEGGIADRWWNAFQWAQVGTPPCWCRSIGDTLIRVDGVGTTTLRIRFDAVANANHDCVSQCRQGQCNCPSDYKTGAYAIIDYTLFADIEGVDDPTEVVVTYRWSQMSANRFRPEAPGPTGQDTSQVIGTQSGINGTSLGGDEFDFDDVRGSRSNGGTGSYTTVASPTLAINAAISYVVGLLVEIKPAARGQPHPCLEYDSESVAAGLEVVLIISMPGGGDPPPPPEPEPAAELRYSVRIGSDLELSDPTPDGNEGLDPGDAYVAPLAALPVGGVDGLLDDAIFFGGDPPPDPPDGSPPGSGAPACSGLSPALARTPYLERDAMDQIDFSLAGLIASQPTGLNGAPAAPIPASTVGGSGCVHDAEYLVISYADRSSGNFAGCDVPVTTASPLGETYGSTPERDEVLGLMVMPDAFGGAAPLAAATYALFDEDALGLSPSPPPTEPPGLPPPQDADDDVNALNAVAAGVAACGVELFSVSHEASGPPDLSSPTFPPPPMLDAGHVYEYDPAVGAPVLAVHKGVHLGLPPGADLDAFEVVWLSAPGVGKALALLFSVDDDDPATAEDESGGLDPTVIYYSFLTGDSAVFVDGLHDNVDAITAYVRPILPPDAQAPQCPTCPGDLTGDGAVTGDDIPPFVACTIDPAACTSPCAEMSAADDVGGAGNVAAFVGKLLGTTDPDPACP